MSLKFLVEILIYWKFRIFARLRKFSKRDMKGQRINSSKLIDSIWCQKLHKSNSWYEFWRKLGAFSQEDVHFKWNFRSSSIIDALNQSVFPDGQLITTIFVDHTVLSCHTVHLQLSGPIQLQNTHWTSTLIKDGPLKTWSNIYFDL